MSVSIVELLRYCDDLLMPTLYNDYCPNGLQVTGKQEIKKIVSGVTASKALLESAVDAEADAILVHHGYFWKGDNPCIDGILKERLKLLFEHDINLLAYHLPLDAHPTLGNNAQLGLKLSIQNGQPLDPNDNSNLIYTGQLAKAQTGPELAEVLAERLGRRPVHVPGGGGKISNLAWCTGAAQGFFEQAVKAGIDAYITGEISEQTTHIAREYGVDFYAAGHHATERYGPSAVGQNVAEQFHLEHQFIDIDNPA